MCHRWKPICARAHIARRYVAPGVTQSNQHIRVLRDARFERYTRQILLKIALAGPVMIRTPHVLDGTPRRGHDGATSMLAASLYNAARCVEGS